MALCSAARGGECAPSCSYSTAFPQRTWHRRVRGGASRGLAAAPSACSVPNAQFAGSRPLRVATSSVLSSIGVSISAGHGTPERQPGLACSLGAQESQRRRSHSAATQATTWSGGQSDGAPTSLASAAAAYAQALYKFSRPHTMYGTALSVLSISLLALDGAAVTGAAVRATAMALSSALLMNM